MRKIERVTVLRGEALEAGGWWNKVFLFGLTDSFQQSEHLSWRIWEYQ